MKDDFLKQIPLAFFLGIYFSLTAIFLGFMMGGAFGAAEDSIKKALDRSGTVVLESVYQSDVSAKDAVVKKSWEYLKRAHMHWGAIGSAALAAVLTLVLVCRRTRLSQAAALLLGLGALVYPLFWLCAGINAPRLGGTGAAKDYFDFLGLSGAGSCILGMLGALFCVVRDRFSKGLGKS